MKVTRVIIDGEIVAENGKMLNELPEFKFPGWAVNTINIGSQITKDSFKIPSAQTGSVDIRAIEIIPARAGNYEKIVSIPVVDGFVESNTESDLLKTFVVERHKATGSKGMGFVHGFGIKRGALAQTVAHDAHNLIVIGVNDEDMALACNTLIGSGGGACAVCDGVVLGHVPLPIAGIMNDLHAEEMAALVARLERAWKEIGCQCPSPFMTMAITPLACIPELRLTNRGLVDCRTFKFVGLFV